MYQLRQKRFVADNLLLSSLPHQVFLSQSREVHRSLQAELYPEALTPSEVSQAPSPLSRASPLQHFFFPILLNLQHKVNSLSASLWQGSAFFLPCLHRGPRIPFQPLTCSVKQVQRSRRL